MTRSTTADDTMRAKKVLGLAPVAALIAIMVILVVATKPAGAA